MKDTELRLVSELMKNSRRSDRDLAKAIGVSQPTVSRMIKKLEKEGIIKEYTVVPDFCKLGYRLLGLTFVKLKGDLSSEEREKSREAAGISLGKSSFGIVMLERGLGLGYDGVIVSFYEDYSTYFEHKQVLKQYAFLESAQETFLINLEDKVHYRSFTLSTLANHVLMIKQEKKQKSGENE